MDEVREEDLERIDISKPLVVDKRFVPRYNDPDAVAEIVRALEQPVTLQKDLAAKLKLFIESKMEADMTAKGTLTDFTLKAVDLYNRMLNDLHKNQHGDKSTVVNMQVTAAQLTSLIRKGGPRPIVIEAIKPEETVIDERKE